MESCYWQIGKKSDRRAHFNTFSVRRARHQIHGRCSAIRIEIEVVATGADVWIEVSANPTTVPELLMAGSHGSLFARMSSARKEHYGKEED